jgi:hypothetical protein
MKLNPLRFFFFVDLTELFSNQFVEGMETIYLKTYLIKCTNP